MKKLGIAVGLATLLSAGSASANVVYDTITNQPTVSGSSNKLVVTPGLAPLGDAFTAAYNEQISSVEVQLVDNSPAGPVTDSGSVLVYLVPDTSGLPSTSSGITLTQTGLNAAIYLGTIDDNSLVGGLIANNETVTPTNAPTISAGNYWIVLTSGSDPTNYYETLNSTGSSARWEFVAASTAVTDGAIGLPESGYYLATENGADTGFTGSNADAYMMQISAPEPASLSLIGVGLIGIGFGRRWVRKSAS